MGRLAYVIHRSTSARMESMTTGTLTETAKEGEQKLATHYGKPDEPLAGYGALMGTFGTLFLTLLTAAHRTSRVPERTSAADLALLSVATFRLSRIITKDRVTTPFRAPFTRFEKDEGAGEVEEQSRGQGLRRAIGELLTCPYCTGVWTATALTFGLVFAPRSTRLFAGILATDAAAEGLNHAYVKLKESTQ